MRSLTPLLALVISAAVLAATEAATHARSSLSPRPPPSSSASVFAVPRGGGFFGRGRGSGSGGRNQSSRHDGGSGGGGDDSNGGGGGTTTYPPLSRSEIEEKLNVPVWAITDQAGNGAVLATNDNGDGSSNNSNNKSGKRKKKSSERNDDGKSAVYFFLSRQMAEVALKSMQAANRHLDLKLSPLHLGKVWFKLLHGDQDDVELTKFGNSGPDGTPVSEEIVRRKVHMRLVPGVRDLVGARLLLGLEPKDVDRLREAMESDAAGDSEEARRIIQKATINSPNFKAPFNEIPVFMVAQMRVTRKSGDSNSGSEEKVEKQAEKQGEGKMMLPLFLSSKTMLQTHLNFVRESPAWKEVQPTLQLAELHSIVEQMQTESEMDFRNIILFPASPDEDADGGGGNNDDDDDDDDDDGGDGSIKREPDAKVDYADIECTPFVSMEMGVFEAPGVGQGQELVSL